MNALVDPGQIGMGILASFKQGQQEGEQKRYRNALGDYAMNPTPQGLAQIAPYDPQFVMQERQAQAQQQQAQAQQHQQQLPIISRLLDHATDQNSYQQALGIAHQYGIDVSQAPPNYDPQWVGNLKQMVAVLGTPQGQEALSNAGKQAVDLGYKPGTPEFAQVTHQLVEAALAQPYTGSQGETRLYTPQIGGPGQVQGASPPPEAIAELRQNPASAQQFDEIFGPGSAARLLGNGGPQVAPAAGFPGAGG